MWDDDGELRAELSRQAADHGRTNAASALDAMQPAMRRIRRRSVAARSATLTLAAIATAGAVYAARTPSSDSLVVDGDAPSVQVGTTAPPFSDTTTAITVTSTAVRQAGDADRPPGTEPPRPTATAITATSMPTAEPDDDTVPPTVATPAPQPVGTPTTAPAPPDDASDDVSDDATDDETDDETPDATTPPGAPTGVLSATSNCGSVRADFDTSPPTILSIEPAAGYTYRVEDPEPHRVVVQFTGSSEDCEVKLPAGSDD